MNKTRYLSALIFLLDALFFLCISGFSSRFFSCEASFQNSLVFANNKTSDYHRTFVSMSLTKDTDNWYGSPFQKDIQESSVYWPINSDNNVSFLLNTGRGENPVKIGIENQLSPISVFGIPHVSGKGSDYGFFFSNKGGVWSSDFGQNDIYISEAISILYNVSVGDVMQMSTKFSKSNVMIRGVVGGNNIDYFQTMLGNDFVVLPFSSALRNGEFSGESAYFSSLGQDYFQNLTMLKTFDKYKNNQNIKLAFYSTSAIEENPDFTASLLSYETIRQSVSSWLYVTTLFLAMGITILDVIMFSRLRSALSKFRNDAAVNVIFLPLIAVLFVFLVMFFFFSRMGINTVFIGFLDPVIFCISSIFTILLSALSYLAFGKLEKREK